MFNELEIVQILKHIIVNFVSGSTQFWLRKQLVIISN